MTVLGGGRVGGFAPLYPGGTLFLVGAPGTGGGGFPLNLVI